MSPAALSLHRGETLTGLRIELELPPLWGQAERSQTTDETQAARVISVYTKSDV